MGFERLCMVVQNVQSNYDTDVFMPIIREIETITETIYGKDEKTDIAIRVIADHIRAVAFAIADGQLPSNNGAGYVIRRILRRAIRYGFTFLNQKEAFIYKLTDVLSSQMGDSFPEIKSQKHLIQIVIKEEENSFLRTLDQGLILLDNIINNTNGKTISGAKGFELYDTFGFPKDLTALILREKGLEFDEEGFSVEMEKQKARSRSAANMDTSDWVPLLEDDVEEFIGYDYLESNIKITRYRKITTKKDGDMFQLVFNLTPFYAEGGGQIGDRGYLEAPNGDVIYILDTKKENNLILHFAKNLPKNPSQIFRAVVDKKTRFSTECNHSATHLLHQALRKVLGEHVEQKGSAVYAKGLRFDFSHFSKLTDSEIKEVETFVNARISEKLPLKEHRNIPIEEAQKEGALMLFGEKYGDTVRTIKFGTSMELCGGTHVKNTGDIWYFKILSESAIAAGIRRIEAITYEGVKDFFINQNKELNKIKLSLKNPSNILQTITNIQSENTSLKKELEQLLKEKAGSLKEDLLKNIENINGVNFISTEVKMDGGTIKTLAFDLANKVDQLFFIAGSNVNNKAILTVYISKDLVEERKLNAGNIVRELGKYIQGGGGGQPFFATAGGKNPGGIKEALENAKEFIK
jgi:alanyl-tRNA synthetase